MQRQSNWLSFQCNDLRGLQRIFQVIIIVSRTIKHEIFLRRSVKNAKKFACAFGKMCSVTPQNRRKCQYCRYQKCLAVGMKAECVLNDDELAEKRKMISRNRIRRILNQPAQMKGKSLVINIQAKFFFVSLSKRKTISK